MPERPGEHRGNPGDELPPPRPDRESRSGAAVDAVVSMAGIHAALLGDRSCSDADRDAAGELLLAVPGIVAAAHQNQCFRERALRFLVADCGMRQVLDYECGSVPAAPNVQAMSQPARRTGHASEVAARTQERFGEIRAVRATLNDLHQPVGFPAHSAQSSLDLTAPVAVIFTAVGHHLADDPARLVRSLMADLAPGSYLVLSHAASEQIGGASAAAVRRVCAAAGAQFIPRDRAEITGFFDGLELIPPGVVSVARWRPGRLAHDPRRTLLYAGVARKA